MLSRDDSFDIIGVDGSKSGPIHFKDKATMNAWFLRVTVKIQILLAQMVRNIECHFKLGNFERHRIRKSENIDYSCY